MRNCLKCFITLSILLLVSVSTSAGNKTALPAPTKLSKHSYAWIGPLPGPAFENQGYRMNMGFVVGTKGIVVIDTGYTEKMARQMLVHIRSVSKAPIIAAVNTNSQPHRFFGNRVFKLAGADIIAHPAEKKRMDESMGRFSSNIERILKLPANSVPLPALPDSMVENKKIIDLGGVHIVIRHHGGAHTPAPLVVHVQEDNIVFAGDILYSGRMLSVLPASNIRKWISTFNTLKTYGDMIFVPGHGKPAKLDEFIFPTLSYLQRLDAHMTKSVDEGLEAQDAINSFDQSDYKHLVNYEQLAGRNASWGYLQTEEAAFQ